MIKFGPRWLWFTSCFCLCHGVWSIYGHNLSKNWLSKYFPSLHESTFICTWWWFISYSILISSDFVDKYQPSNGTAPKFLPSAHGFLEVKWFRFNSIPAMSNCETAVTRGTVITIFSGLVFLLSMALVSSTTVFVRHSSSMPIPVLISTIHMDSEVRCALDCSWNAWCDLYHFNTSELTCSQYQAPEWPRDAVYPDVSSHLSFKGSYGNGYRQLYVVYLTSSALSRAFIDTCDWNYIKLAELCLHTQGNRCFRYIFYLNPL